MPIRIGLEISSSFCSHSDEFQRFVVRKVAAPEFFIAIAILLEPIDIFFMGF